MKRLATLVILLMLLPGCKPFEAEWRTTSAIKAAAELTDKAIAEAAVKEHNRCIKAHKAGTPEYKVCIESSKPYKALIGWRKFGKPTINAALIAAVAAIQIAERAKGSKLDIAAVLRPAACALAKMVEQYGDLFQDKAPVVIMAIAMVKGVSCE
jgi:hypothetical protein